MGVGGRDEGLGPSGRVHDLVSGHDGVGQMHGRRTTVGVWSAAAGSLGALWAWRVLRRTYFVQDEWAMIRRGAILGPVESATKSFNGHLWLFQDASYRAQALGFGLDSNRFIVAAFLVALVTLHLTLAAFARSLGMSLAPALLLGALLTYLGPAAQNYVFAVQISPTLATAAAIGASTLVIGSPGTVRRATLVATLVLLSVLLDSAVGLLASSLAGGLVVQLWPRRRWWVLAPGGLVTMLWYAFADLGPEFPAPFGDRVTFAVELTVRSAGALVGGGPRVGLLVVIVFVAAIVAHARAGEMAGRDRAVTIAAVAATTILVGAIAQSRAGAPVFSFFENNRYLQNVAIPMALAVVPSSVGLVRRAGAGTVGAVAMSVVLVGAFLFGQDEARRYEDQFVGRSIAVRNAVVDTVSLLSTNCPSGQPPVPDVELLGPVSPGLTVSLVAVLARRGLLSPAPPGPPDGALVATICPP